jgi:acyl-CoA reductase-like NAD-dependent aldehyde dehydrogenase
VQVLSLVETVNEAVASSHTAFRSDAWSQQASVERGKVLQEIAQVLSQNEERLCYLEALDTGISIAQVRVNHVAFAIQILEYYAALATQGLSGRIF